MWLVILMMRLISRFCLNDSSVSIKLSKTQLSKMEQLGGFFSLNLFPPLKTIKLFANSYDKNTTVKPNKILANFE